MKSTSHDEQAIQFLLERIVDPVMVYERSTLNLLAVNEMAVRAYGHSREQLLGLTILDLHAPDDLGSLTDLVHNPVLNDEQRRTWRHARKNGDIVEIAVTLHPLTWGSIPAGMVQAHDVTARSWVEAEIKRATDLLRAVAETTTDALFVKDATGRYLLFNRAAAQFVGQPPEKVLGNDDRALFDAAGADRVMQRDLEVMASGQTRTEEEELTAAGVTRIYLATKAPFRDESGNVIGVIGVSRDITDKKRTEQSLCLSEERYRTLIEAITAIVWSTPASGEFTTEQLGWSRFTGQTFDELKGQGWLDAVHPEDRDHTATVWAHAITNRLTYIVEHRLRAASGEYRNMSVRAVPIYNSDGTIREWVGVHKDVTEQRLSADALRASETRLSEALRIAGMGYWNRDLVTDEVEWSDELYGMFGVPHDGKTLTFDRFLTFVHPGDREAVNRCIEEAIAQRKSFEQTYRVVVAGEVKAIHERGRVVGAPGEHGGRILGTAQDVSERMRADEALRSSEARLQHAIVNVPFPAMVHAEDGEVLLISNVWTELTGYLHGDIPTIEMWTRKAYGDESGAQAARIRKLYALENRHHTGEFRVRTGAGSVLIWDFWATPLGVLPDGRRFVLSMAGDVTVRQNAEAELQASELRFRQVVENQTEVVCRFLPGGIITFVNDAFCRTFGKPAESLLGRDWRPTVHPEDQAEVSRKLDQLTFTNPVIVVENRVFNGDGDVLWMEFVNRGFFDREGKLALVQSVGRDITERRGMEAALRESEWRFRAVFNSMFQFIGILSLEGVLLAANETSLAAGGLNAHEVIGRPFWETRWWTLSPATQPQLKDAISRAAAGEFVRYEVDIRGPDDRILTVDFSLKPVTDDMGQVTLLIPEARDVTEQKKSELALRVRDRAVRATSQGIVITDSTLPDHPIIYANPGFEALTGYSSADAHGRNCRFLQGPDTDPQAVSAFREAIAEGRELTVELLNYRKDGTTFWNEVSLSPVRDDANRITNYVGVQVDVTQRRQLDARLRQSHKMEAIGQLAGGVAHDFNNMLAVITGYSASLAESERLNDDEREAIREIRSAAQRSATLTRQLLAFSRQQVLKPTVLNVNDIVVEMEKMLRALIGEDVEVRTALDPALWPIRIDPGQLEQVILNLAVNARDAMPLGGLLHISTSNAASQDSPLTGEERSITLSVADTGCGMDEATQARIFEPFFTTKEQGKGTGLGLASVYGIVNQSGGQIELSSAPQSGSTFTIRFPALVGSERECEDDDEGALPPERGNETLLLVEDEESVRKLFVKVLASQGYTVLAASSGAQALAEVHANKHSIDLVVTDVVMPEMSGRQLVERLRSTHPMLKVLFMSGYTDDAVVRHGIEEATVNFIQKPFSPTSLARKVRDVLDAAK
jgi:two-component system cell cycle sensor histidine kinase/response regulator CckA